MPSSATSRNRLEKQGAGENANAWGTKLNATVFDLVDEALDGRASFTLSGSKTLSATNFASDEARKRVLDVTGGTGGTVTIPAVEKWYMLRNASSGNVVVTTGAGATATIGAGLMAILFCDGTNVRLDGNAASASTSATAAAASAAAAAASAAAAAASESGAEVARALAELAGTNAADAATVAAGAAEDATDSADNAATSVTSAGASASAAGGSATSAATSAGSASASAGAAAASAAAADASADEAAASAASVNPANFMHLSGAETASGLKTFSDGIAINGQTLSAVSAQGKAIVEAATYAAMKALLELEIGSDVQAWDALLDSIAALSFGGNGGKVLAVNGGETAFELSTVSAGNWTQIGQVATTSGATWDFTNIPDSYDDLLILIEGYSGSSTGGLSVALSPDGSSYSSAANLQSTLTAADAYHASIWIPNYNRDSGLIQRSSLTANMSSPAVTVNAANPAQWRVTGGIQAIRFTTNTGNGDAGTITLFAR